MRLIVSLIISALPGTAIVGFIYSRFISQDYTQHYTLFSVEADYQGSCAVNSLDCTHIIPITRTISGMVTLRVNDYQFQIGNAPLSPYIPPLDSLMECV